MNASSTRTGTFWPTVRVLCDVRLVVFNALIVVLSPLMLGAKIGRFLSRRRGREFDWWRWSCPVLNARRIDNNSPRILLVGTGFGEMKIVQQLSSALSSTRSDVQIIWATRDRDVAQQLARDFPHQPITMLPFDFLLPCLFLLQHARPDVVVLIEKFWFSNVLRCAKVWGAKVVVVNARTRSHEGFRYRLMRPFHRWLLGAFATMCFQSDDDLKKVQTVLPLDVRAVVTGNLKFDVQPDTNDERRESLKKWIAQRGDVPLFVAGSTAGADDENWIMRAFVEVRKHAPCALLIAPRRLHKLPETLLVLEQFGFRALLRSKNVSESSNFEYSNEEHNESVFVLDTMGELNAAYQFATAAFVGGTISGAGHNVAEPLVWGVPVSYGPQRGYFEAVQKACEKAGIGFRVHTPEALATHWVEVLRDNRFCECVQPLARKLLEEQSGALESNIREIVSLLGAVKISSSNKCFNIEKIEQ